MSDLSQAHPPTDAEQVVTYRTANAQLHVRVAELEKAKDAWRGVAELLVCLADPQERITALVESLVESEARWDVLTEQYTQEALRRALAETEQAKLLLLARAVVLSMSRPIGYEGVTLVDTAKLRELEARVSSTEVKREPSPMEETQVRCARCFKPLNNISPGISVASDGYSICTPCLRPGEVEVARARSI